MGSTCSNVGKYVRYATYYTYILTSININTYNSVSSVRITDMKHFRHLLLIVQLFLGFDDNRKVGIHQNLSGHEEICNFRVVIMSRVKKLF